MAGVPNILEEAVLKPTVKDSDFNPKDEVKGYDFNKGIDYDQLLKTYRNLGFQATNFALAVEEINKMIECREAPINEHYIDNEDPFTMVKYNCTIFLGYTSNIISSGLREVIRFLVQHSLVCAYCINARLLNTCFLVD